MCNTNLLFHDFIPFYFFKEVSKNIFTVVCVCLHFKLGNEVFLSFSSWGKKKTKRWNNILNIKTILCNQTLTAILL